MSSSHRIPLLLVGISLAALSSGCATTTRSADLPEAVPATPIGNRPLPDAELGKYLADLSSSIGAWTEKTWSAASSEDKRKQDLLELSIMERSHRRKGDLLRELETGPVHNRIVAAAALGFTRDPEVLSPLLAALYDSNDKVRSNALLGLTLLQDADTPPVPICEILSTERDSKLRCSVAYCLRSLAEAGVENPCIRRSGRLALTDDEPMVRAQAALLLAQIDDVESISQIAALLYDGFPLVSSAASRSIAALGSRNIEHKGPAARALVQAMEEGQRELRKRVLGDLVALSGNNFALDVARWKEWAYRLP